MDLVKKELSYKVELVKELSAASKEKMYSIYCKYYGGTSQALFETDLNKQNFFILIFNKTTLVGFSGLMIFQASVKGEAFGIIYSGDTVIQHEYWGSPILMKSWLNFVYEIYNKQSSIPWFWLLLVKGHRTYRYLNLFFKEYYPRPNQNIPLDWKEKRDLVTTFKFGKDFNSERSLVEFKETRGFLKEEWAGLNHKTDNHPEALFFKQANPNFQQGDELVCFCKISEDNFQKRALKQFLKADSAKFLPTDFQIPTFDISQNTLLQSNKS